MYLVTKIQMNFKSFVAVQNLLVKAICLPEAETSKYSSEFRPPGGALGPHLKKMKFSQVFRDGIIALHEKPHGHAY